MTLSSNGSINAPNVGDVEIDKTMQTKMTKRGIFAVSLLATRIFKFLYMTVVLI